MCSKKVNCELVLSAIIVCPNEECHASFNLFDVEALTCDGYLYETVFDGTIGVVDWDEVVRCPDCKMPFLIGAIRY